MFKAGGGGKSHNPPALISGGAEGRGWCQPFGTGPKKATKAQWSGQDSANA